MVLEVRGLGKSFGRRRAVESVSFQVEVGEVVAVLGPNGAGKTTLMRMIAGYLEPDEGQVRVFKIDMADARARAQERVGYLPEGAPLYGEMTPWAYLRFIAEARGLAPDAVRHAVRRAAIAAHLDDTIERPIDTLSKGYRRRVGLAAALLHDPLILLLDEPTDGLDPNQRQGVRALIRELGVERAILISTHNLEDVEAMCTRVVMVHRGRVTMDASPDKLKARFGDLEAAFRELTHAQERIEDGPLVRAGARA